VLHRVRLPKIGLDVNDVSRRMLRKIFFELVPRARHDPLAGIDTAQHSAENMARERSRFDVATRRSSPSLKINVCLLATHENPVCEPRSLGQIMARPRWLP